MADEGSRLTPLGKVISVLLILGLIGLARESLSLSWLRTRVADMEEGE